jgi:hypothetical protein
MGAGTVSSTLHVHCSPKNLCVWSYDMQAGRNFERCWLILGYRCPWYLIKVECCGLLWMGNLLVLNTWFMTRRIQCMFELEWNMSQGKDSELYWNDFTCCRYKSCSKVGWKSNGVLGMLLFGMLYEVKQWTHYVATMPICLYVCDLVSVTKLFERLLSRLVQEVFFF